MFLALDINELTIFGTGLTCGMSSILNSRLLINQTELIWFECKKNMSHTKFHMLSGIMLDFD